MTLMETIKHALVERTKTFGSWIYDYPEAADELVAALRPDVEQWERANMTTITNTATIAPLDEAAERVRFKQWAEREILTLDPALFVRLDAETSRLLGEFWFGAQWQSWLAAKRDERERS